MPDRTVYMSNNLEANYVLPSSSTDFTQGLYEKILFVDGVEDAPAESTARRLENFNIFSRKNVYRLIENKMESYGLDGHACLLRMICEVSESSLHETNGVLGNVVHILLT